MTVPTQCREAVEHLWAYVAGDAAPAEEAVVEQHLAHCLRCCGEVAFARELQRRLAVATPEMPREVERRLDELADVLEPEPRRP